LQIAKALLPRSDLQHHGEQQNADGQVQQQHVQPAEEVDQFGHCGCA
jgi:hypothetical protein